MNVKLVLPYLYMLNNSAYCRILQTYNKSFSKLENSFVKRADISILYKIMLYPYPLWKVWYKEG